MKTTFRIAKNELYTLFYSPIAWLILIIFSFQVYSGFTGLLGYFTNNVILGRGLSPNVTLDLFARGGGAPFEVVTSYLFLYVPLLTMGLISQEQSGGTIKLLFSSPVTGTQIILGKFLAMMFYGLLLIAVLLIPLGVSEVLVPKLVTPMVIIGLLGIYLLFCTYAAIGLFMSTLTNYQMIAALGTLTTLSVLNFVGKLGQSIDFIRDISYWLSISGRTDKLLWGLICSEDLIYFIVITIMFVGLSIFKLESGRQNNSLLVKVAKYGGFIAACLLIGYITSRPVFKFYYDSTEHKQHTLTPNSQKILSEIKGDITMTTYVNLLDNKMANYVLPKSRNNDKRCFEQYLRFKPKMKMKYVMYYDSIIGSNITKDEMQKQLEQMIVVNDLNPKKILTPEQIHKIIDLTPEENRVVRVIETENGNKAFLRMYEGTNPFPTEKEISVAFKSLINKEPLVAFVSGHNERNFSPQGDLDYGKFTKILTQRESLINQGFKPVEISIAENDVPENVDILFIADPQIAYTPKELNSINKYIEKGGNLIIAGEPRHSSIINQIISQLGIVIIPGTMVHPSESDRSDLLFVPIHPESGKISSEMGRISGFGAKIAMPSAGGLGVFADKGYKIYPLVVTEASGYWNEMETTNFTNEVPSFSPSKGEIEGMIPTIIALSRKTGKKEQKIIVSGDADFISNAELSMNRDVSTANWPFIIDSFKWLSDDEYPVDITRPEPADDKIDITAKSFSVIKITLKWLIPSSLLLLYVLIWLKRRRQ